MPSPLLLIPAAGVGLYFLFRKKPGFTPQPISAPPVMPAARMAEAVAPAGSPQAAADKAIVDFAFGDMQNVNNSGFSSGPAADFFTPGAPGGPPPISVVEPASPLASLADVAQDPFGALGSLLGSSVNQGGGGGGGSAPVFQDSNLSFDPGSGLNKDRDLGGTEEEEAGFFDFGD